MKTQHVHKNTKHWYYWGVLSITLMLPSDAIAITIEGLSISDIGRQEPVLVRELKENVDINFLPEDNQSTYNIDTDTEDREAWEESSESSEDIDMEEIGSGKNFGKVAKKIDKVKSSNGSRRIRNKHNPDYDFTNNYVKKTEDIPTPSRLAKDAKCIHEAETNPRSRDSTTILCVALRDQHGHIKRFVFHNSASIMGPKLRDKAQELGYDVIKAEKAHAEGQLLQFLYNRKLKRPTLYTHIVGMGCSRLHCKNCDDLCLLILGAAYRSKTAAVNQEISRTVASISEVSLTSDDPTRLCLAKTEEIVYGVNLGQDSVDLDKTYKNYPTPPGLEKLINIHEARQEYISSEHVSEDETKMVD